MTEYALASSLAQRVDEIERRLDRDREIAVKERDELFDRTEKLAERLAALAVNAAGIRVYAGQAHHDLGELKRRVERTRWARFKAWWRRNVYDTSVMLP